jgi:hypothetical protein
VCTEARTVLRAVATDFYCNWWCIEFPSDSRIRHIPRCVHYHAHCFRLEAFYLFIYVLEVEAVFQSCIQLSADWFEYCFICEKFVACGEFCYTSKLRIHFGESIS